MNYTRTCMETRNALKKSKDYALGKKFSILIFIWIFQGKV